MKNKRQHNCQKKKDKRTKHTHKTKDQVTRIPLKTGGELRCFVRVNSSCSTSDTCRFNRVVVTFTIGTSHSDVLRSRLTQKHTHTYIYKHPLNRKGEKQPQVDHKWSIISLKIQIVNIYTILVHCRSIQVICVWGFAEPFPTFRAE